MLTPVPNWQLVRDQEPRASIVPATLAALVVLLLTFGAKFAGAHPDSASSPPLRPTRVRLRYQKPADIVALFARERSPSERDEHVPRAARSDCAESLLPPGVDAVLPAGDSQQLLVVGTERHPSELRDCIAVLDVPIQQVAPNRERIILRPRHADPHRVRLAVLRLPDGGSASVSGRQLTLEGSAPWLHRALRQMIRGELNEPAALGQSSPRSIASTVLILRAPSQRVLWTHLEEHGSSGSGASVVAHSRLRTTK